MTVATREDRGERASDTPVSAAVGARGGADAAGSLSGVAEMAPPGGAGTIGTKVAGLAEGGTITDDEAALGTCFREPDAGAAVDELAASVPGPLAGAS